MTNKYMYFIANWKMFGVLNSLNSVHTVVKFLKNFKKNNSLKIIYCPPSTLIRPMTKKLKHTHLDVGAQNCHEHDKFGAFTGSVNSIMLKNVGAKYVIIGHSENRQAGESDKLINLKIKSAITNAIAFKNIVLTHGSFSNYIWGFVNYKPIKRDWSKDNVATASTSLSSLIS